MTRIVRAGLIQCSNPINDEKRPVPEIQAAAIEKHMPFVHEAGKKGVQILCLQEIFNGPYFCPSQDARWYPAPRMRIVSPRGPALTTNGVSIPHSQAAHASGPVQASETTI
jgi:hypothetical protein